MCRLPNDPEGQIMLRYISLGSKAAPVMLGLIATTLSVSAEQAARRIDFSPGTTATTLKGAISGRQDRTFIITATAGQTLQTLFRPSNRSCYFNVYEPGSDFAAHSGSTSGNEFGRNPTVAGEYRFQIYQMRNASRRGEPCNFRLSVELTGAPGGSSAGISDTQLRDRCKSEAATMYGVEPRQILVRQVRQTANGFSIDGTADKGPEGIKKRKHPVSAAGAAAFTRPG
jgi:hypothetical protein